MMKSYFIESLLNIIKNRENRDGQTKCKRIETSFYTDSGKRLFKFILIWFRFKLFLQHIYGLYGFDLKLKLN